MDRNDLAAAEVEAKKTVSDWNDSHPDNPPFKYWGGGKLRPHDWDEGEYLCRDGKTYYLRGYDWQHGTNCSAATADWDRIGYRPKEVKFMTPLERAGKAVSDNLGKQAEQGFATVSDVGRYPVLDGCIDTQELARAVLLAIREPSEEIVKSGHMAAVTALHRYGGYRMEDIWQAMIDKALEEW